MTLTILVLPIAGLLFFRIYENQLVRETESELISQAAFVDAFVKAKVRAAGADGAAYGTPVENEPYALVDPYYTPIGPQADLADDIGPDRPSAIETELTADPLAIRIGRETTAVFTEAQKVTLAGFRLLDPRGIVIGGQRDIGLSYAHVDEVQRAMQGLYAGVLRHRISDDPQPALTSISRGQRLRVFVAYPIVSEQRLLAIAYLSRTPENILKSIYLARDRLLLAAASAIGLALLLGYIATRTIVSPISALNERSRQLASGDMSALTSPARAGTRELAELSDSFADMANALHLRARTVRDFASHVSHEFKSPLTSIRGAAELIAEGGEQMTTEARLSFASNIVEDSDRLRRLVERLHDIARAEHAATFTGVVDLTAALQELTVEQSTAAFRVKLVCDAEQLLAAIPAESFHIVVSNLIANAIENGASEITIALKAMPEKAVVSFTDNGRGVAAVDRPRIFEPFFTTRRGAGGTGLGLGIVRDSLEAYRASIDLAESERGATFVVQIPKSRLSTVAKGGDYKL